MRFTELEKLVNEMEKDKDRFNLNAQGLITVYLLRIYNELKKLNTEEDR